MIVCRRCSRRHPDGTEFCTCGAYLEFDGDVVADEPAGSPPATGDATTSTSDSAAATDAHLERGAWSGLPDDGPRRPQDDDAMAVRPMRDHRPSGVHEPVTTSAPTNAGDIRCGACGTYNSSRSTYCRHCAQSLTQGSGLVAEDPDRTTRRSWFRRRKLDTRQVVGQARRRRGLARRVMLMRAGGVAAVVAVLVALLGPWGGRATDGLRSSFRLERFEQIDVDPDDVTAIGDDGTEVVDGEFPYRGAENVVDGLSNTAWATRWIDPADLGDTIGDDPDAEGCVPWATTERLQVTFGPAVDIDRIQVLGGRFADDPTRDDFHRPRVVQFEHDGDCRLVTLEDDGTLVEADVTFRDVTALTVGVVAVFDGDTTDPAVEIGEIVFERS